MLFFDAPQYYPRNNGRMALLGAIEEISGFRLRDRDNGWHISTAFSISLGQPLSVIQYGETRLRALFYSLHPVCLVVVSNGLKMTPYVLQGAPLITITAVFKVSRPW